MKIVLIIAIICGNVAFAQSGLTETEKLAATSKIWGFLKYYHPAVADGKFDWDNELFEVLPKVKTAKNREQLSQIFIEWIHSLGKVKLCKKCKDYSVEEYFDKNLDLRWINDDNLFTNRLSEELLMIRDNRHQGNKYYVTANGRVGNIKIKNETIHDELNWDNENLRILSLFRYWNIIEYFFPYKYQTDQAWNDVLHDMIPKFLYSNTELDYHLAMLELVVNLNDSHAGFSTKLLREYFGEKWIPARFKVIDGKAIITGFFNDSLAKKDDLRIGDVLTKIDGKDIDQLINENKKYIPASNNSIKLRNAPYFVFRGNSDSVIIDFFREDVLTSKTIGRCNIQELNFNAEKKTQWEIIDDNIALVNMGELRIKEVPGMMEEILNTKGLIIDLRQYPNGTLKSLLKYISSRRIPLYKKTVPDLNYPGRYIWKVGNDYGNVGELIYKGKVVLLINEFTQSQAEATAMGLRTGDNVTVIGSQSSGADGNICNIEFVGGFETMFSGIGWFYPDGRETQRIGIIPDIEVSQTILGIQQGRDQVLERAIEFLEE